MLDAGPVHYVWRGRTAMDAVYRIMGLNPGDRVLLPAYHCVSMVEPVLRAGGTPVFFRLLSDTRVDLDDLRDRIGPRTIAAVVPHYFGFHQRISEIRATCDELGIRLIEDCAHCFFGSIDGRPVGSFGHFAIGSAWKFLPVMEGGCMVINERGFRMTDLRKPGLKAELKSVINNVERSLDHGRLRASGILFRPMIRLAGLRGGKTATYAEDENPRMANAEPVDSIKGLTHVSRLIIRHSDMARAVRIRRDHYQYLHSIFNDMEGAKPLHSSLPDTVAPQVYPLVMNNPETVFPRLLEAGVPVIRFGEYLWEGMDASLCPVTQFLSRSVFQIPCHQELTQDEIRWIGETVRRITDN